MSKPSLLIGNGFNMALKKCNSDINVNLSYEEIFKAVTKKVKNEGKNEGLLEVLKKSEEKGITDLELLLLKLKNLEEGLNFSTDHYCKTTEEKIELLSNDRKILRKAVVEVMTDQKFHPKYIDIFNNISLSRYIEICAENLRAFERIFTINYDLILYWLLNNLGLLKKDGNKEKFQDGFTPDPSFKPTENGKIIDNLYGFSTANIQPNIYFLHGALHLISKDGDTFKIVTPKDGLGLKLADIRKILLESHSELDNLLVFNPTSHDKVQEIMSNAYLKKGYDKIQPVSGDIVIYGCNFLNENYEIDLGNDIHLWHKVVNSKTKKIYAGIPFSEKNDLDRYAEKLGNELSRHKYNSSCIKVFCFSYETTSIWESDDFYKDITKGRSPSPYQLKGPTT